MNTEANSDKRETLLNTILKAGGDPADLPFWQACESGKFLIHHCERCGRNYWPASRCIVHGDESMVWVEASGRGTLHTYTIMHRAMLPAMQDKVPYVIGVVKLEEGPYYHSNIIDCEHSLLAVDMVLEVKMQSHSSGLTLPMFTPVTAA